MHLLDEVLDQWNQALQDCLSSHVPIELLSDQIDLIIFGIADHGIEIKSTDQDLSLGQLENHSLCHVLQDVLGCISLDAVTQQQCQVEPIESFSLLTSSLIDRYLNPRVADSSSSMASKKQSVIRECELCGRTMPLTIHHLIPRSTHTYFLRHQHLLQLSGTATATNTHTPPLPSLVTKDDLLSRQARLCRPCHSQIHKLIPDHRELGKEYNTVTALMEHEDVRKWCAWIQGQRVSDSGMGQRVRYRR